MGSRGGSTPMLNKEGSITMRIMRLLGFFPDVDRSPSFIIS